MRGRPKTKIGWLIQEAITVLKQVKRERELFNEKLRKVEDHEKHDVIQDQQIQYLIRRVIYLTNVVDRIDPYRDSRPP